MQDIGYMSQLLSEYGPFIVILSVFLVIFITIIGFILRTNKKATEASADLNKEIVTSILNEFFENNSHRFGPKKHYDERNLINIFMELNKTLKSACEHTMRKSNSDRTAIYVFHNGNHSSHGLPFVRVTCICETISKYSNTNIKIQDHTGITVSTFDSIITGLYDNSEHRICMEETTDPTEIVFLHNTKIKDCYMVPIYDDDNNMMGFVFNGYNTTNNSRNMEKEKEYIIDLANIAQPVIEYSNVQEYQNKED